MKRRSVFADMREHQHCTGALARDMNGLAVGPTCAIAETWCALGWLDRCAMMGWSKRQISYRRGRADAVAHKLGYKAIPNANDILGWAYIEALKKAGV